MLTLVLLVGAVSCSPVPSEPSLQASATHHGTSPAGAAPLEITHGAHQVTFEVNEELGETTASTTSSELSGEDDPPIPTATTPPVLPDGDTHAHDAHPAVTEPHRTQPHQTQQPQLSHGSPLVIQPHEVHDTHHHEPFPQLHVTPHHDLQSNSSHSSHSQPQTSILQVTQPNATTSGVTHNHNPEANVTQSRATDQEASPSHERSSEETLPHIHKVTEETRETVNEEAAPQTAGSLEASTEKSSSSREAVEHSSEHKGLQSPIKRESTEASTSRESIERTQQSKSNLQNSNNGSAVHHTLFHHHPHEEVETVVEADLHSWESSEHRHFSPSAIKAAAEAKVLGEDLAGERNEGIRNVAALNGRVSEALQIGDSHEEGKEKIEYIDTVALSTDTEEDTTDEIVAGGQQVSEIQISLAKDGAPQHSHETTGNDGKPSEERTEGDIKSQTHELTDSVEKQKESDENRERKHTGEMEELPSLVMDSSSPIDIVERSEEAEREVLEGAASETVVETAPREAKLTPPAVVAEEGRRRSRIYPKSSTEEESHSTTHEEALKVQDQKESQNTSDSKLHQGGLESMSMTSPNPDTPQGEGTLLTEEAEATIVPPETFTEADDTPAAEAGDKTVGTEEGSVPAPSAAPLPTEDYTDNYSDPISTGNLPDLVVTQEEIPSLEHPLTDLPLLSTSDKETAGGGSLRKEGKVAWALPPQQEQVSAVAPNSLTPGCIVAIVFGVILSAVVVLGIGGFVVYQRRTLNRPKVLGSDRGYAGSDSGGYIDDQVRVSYVNSQIDSPKGQTYQPPQGEQVPQVLIHLRSLKPSFPKGLAAKFPKALPSMPKVAPMNLPKIGQFISKWESRGSNQSGQ
ncbi:uncharacterized protein LOC126995529 isoform X2 [Eriocheir sinensis]|nr:uncharacterized protein LOC126995529 isoform X2 [Eriocheir sinensis]